MEVVVPHRVEAEAAPLGRQQLLRMLRLVLGDHDDRARLRGFARSARELREDVRSAVVEDRLRRVEAQSVQVELADPVARVAENEIARALRVLAVEVQRFAPFGVVARAEVVRAEALQVVAVRPEVVVDDVEDHGEPERVRAVDEALECIGVAIHVIRRKQLHAVVAPVPAARALGDRHHLDHRDAELAQVAELLGRGVERALPA